MSFKITDSVLWMVVIVHEGLSKDVPVGLVQLRFESGLVVIDGIDPMHVFADNARSWRRC